MVMDSLLLKAMGGRVTLEREGSAWGEKQEEERLSK